MTYLNDIMERARERSWASFGRQITFYLPGMFSCDGASGKYPAISITGTSCRLQCAHCQGKLLSPMIHAPEPDLLVEKCLQLERKGNLGVLVSGGCDEEGRLPWGQFSPALQEVKKQTGLKVSVHGGFVDEVTAKSLKEAGIDQVLVDVIGDGETYREVFHLKSGVSRLISSLEALKKARLPIVPHIVCGLHYGRMKGEKRALDIVSGLDVRLLVIVSLMRIPDTPMWNTESPAPEAVAELIAEARLSMPKTEIGLGCARERGNAGLEILAIDAGVNRMALPSEEARNRARYYGLEVKYQRTCCSVSEGVHENPW
jgi:hypothetical protein